MAAPTMFKLETQKSPKIPPSLDSTIGVVFCFFSTWSPVLSLLLPDPLSGQSFFLLLAKSYYKASLPVLINHGSSHQPDLRLFTASPLPASPALFPLFSPSTPGFAKGELLTISQAG